MSHTLLLLIPFVFVCFLQNMAFTWSSRSRNSGDPTYHRKAALCSNGVYYLTNALLTVYIIHMQVWWMLLLQGIVYTLSATEGSVYMMRCLLKHEKGKRAAGASAKYAQIPIEEYQALRDLVFVQGQALLLSDNLIDAERRWHRNTVYEAMKRAATQKSN